MSGSLNIADWIDRVSHRLEDAGLHFGHGTDNAADEAAWLVLHAAGAPLDGSFDDWGRVVEPGSAECIARLLEQRISTGKPLAYLTGAANFAGLEFEVDESVLVPRSPIAELLLDGFRPWVDPSAVRRVLDLCTGSGCIGIATAFYMPEAWVDLADISREALAVAGRNVDKHGVGDRVRIIESDLFTALEGESYDLIVTNPPYVPASSLAGLPREYREEPAIGLASGADGLDTPLAILLDAPRHLCDHGTLVCEVGESAERLDALLPHVPFTWLEFANGGAGVFVLTREELQAAAPYVSEALGKREDVT